MIEDIKNEIQHTKLDVVRIDAQDLIKILKDNTTDEESVIIEIDNRRISGLDEIQKHIALLEGCPTIIIHSTEFFDNMKIYIGPNETHIWSHASYIGAKHKRCVNILKNYISWAGRVAKVRWPVFLSMWVFVLFMLIADNIAIRFSLLAIILTGAPVIMASVLYPYFFSNGVEYAPRQGFFKRNVDNILVGIIMLTIGTIIGVMVEQLRSFG